MRYFMSLLLLVWSVFTFAAAPVEFSDPQKTIFIKANSPFVKITVKSNPTTGYSWLLKKYNPVLIQPLDRDYVPSNVHMPGASGYEIWYFKLMPQAFRVPQLLTIQFAHMQPWTPKTQDLKTFTIVTQLK